MEKTTINTKFADYGILTLKANETATDWKSIWRQGVRLSTPFLLTLLDESVLHVHYPTDAFHAVESRYCLQFRGPNSTDIHELGGKKLNKTEKRVYINTSDIKQL
jgi:hypothetical protein